MPCDDARWHCLMGSSRHRCAIHPDASHPKIACPKNHDKGTSMHAAARGLAKEAYHRALPSGKGNNIGAIFSQCLAVVTAHERGHTSFFDPPLCDECQSRKSTYFRNMSNEQHIANVVTLTRLLSAQLTLSAWYLGPARGGSKKESGRRSQDNKHLRG